MDFERVPCYMNTKLKTFYGIALLLDGGRWGVKEVLNFEELGAGELVRLHAQVQLLPHPVKNNCELLALVVLNN